jgi:hypothetical protein
MNENMAERFLMWFFGDIMPWLLSGSILLTVVALPILWWQSRGAPTIILQAADWACVHTRTESYTTFVMSGKTMVPIVHTREVCTNWVERRGA